MLLLFSKYPATELSLNEGHITTDSQSVTQPHDQIFIIVWQLRSCYCADKRTGLSFVNHCLQ
jgi:hypothetical protein